MVNNVNHYDTITAKGTAKQSRTGRYTNFEDSTVFYIISWYNYHSIWLTQMNTFTHPVKFSSNLSQVTSVYKQYQESDKSS